MGCVFGREVSAAAAAAAKSVERNEGEVVRLERKVVVTERGESQNGVNRKERHNEEERTVRLKRGEKRRPNPRLSNPPKNVHGEQVAAGWPSWLSAVAGEAISGWTPRRADTFQKLDKVKRI